MASAFVALIGFVGGPLSSAATGCYPVQPVDQRRSDSLEKPVIGIGMIGCGTVGTGVAQLLKHQAENYALRTGRKIELRRVLVRDVNKAGRAQDLFPADIVTDDADEFFKTPDISIVIEVAGGLGVGDYVRKAIMTGKHVVTANKSLLAAEGTELFTLARDHDVSIAFEASCAGGIPIVTALCFGLMANRVDGLYGILNGTCNYILTEMTRSEKPYETALREAQEAGFAEADPTLDVNGADSAQKLAILASLAFGVRVHEQQVQVEGIDTLQLFDIAAGAGMGYEIKLLGIAERRASDVTGLPGDAISMRVHPSFVPSEAQLAQVHGSYNAISVFGHATGHTMYFGRGAGQMPTASAVVSDVLNIVSTWYPQAFKNMGPMPAEVPVANVIDPAKLEMRYYVRVMALDVPGVMAGITRVLGETGISISGVVQHEDDAGQFVPVIITTHYCKQGALKEAAKKMEELDVIDGKPIVIPIVDLPED